MIGKKNAVSNAAVRAFVSLLIATLIIGLQGCSDATVASRNLSWDASNFKIERRIVFYNGITDKYILEIEGLCNLEVCPDKLAVTCKTGPDEYKKHYLGLSDNVTFFSEQIKPASESAYHYKVLFKPSVIIPSIAVNNTRAGE